MKLLQNSTPTKNIKERGFTIVELLIVVVIIAILAAITIVSYNGVQARANNSAAQATVNSLTKKIHAYYTLNGSYPAPTTVTSFSGLKTALATYPESALGSGINVGTPTAANGSNTVKVILCTDGVQITPWDYQKSGGAGLAATATKVGIATTGCAASALTSA